MQRAFINAFIDAVGNIPQEIKSRAGIGLLRLALLFVGVLLIHMANAQQPLPQKPLCAALTEYQAVAQ